MLGGISIGGAIMVFFVLPETKQLSLPQIVRMFRADNISEEANLLKEYKPLH